MNPSCSQPKCDKESSYTIDGQFYCRAHLHMKFDKIKESSLTIEEINSLQSMDFRDMQQICKKHNINAKGSRKELTERLLKEAKYL